MRRSTHALTALVAGARSWAVRHGGKAARLAVVLAVVLVVGSAAVPAHDQWPDIEGIDIVPPDPTILDPVSVEVSGTLNIMGQWISDAPWRWEGNSILIDLLALDSGSLAPPVEGAFSETTDIGQLPLGTYDVTARTFVSLMWEPFPDPWEFPDEFKGGPVDTMTTNFTVVPEPSTLIGLLSMGAVSLLAYAWRRRRPRA